jgi:hypothetical protein
MLTYADVYFQSRVIEYTVQVQMGGGHALLLDIELKKC